MHNSDTVVCSQEPRRQFHSMHSHDMDVIERLDRVIYLLELIAGPALIVDRIKKEQPSDPQQAAEEATQWALANGAKVVPEN